MKASYYKTLLLVVLLFQHKLDAVLYFNNY